MSDLQGAPTEAAAGSAGPDHAAPPLRIGGFEVPSGRVFDPIHHLWLAVRDRTARVGLDALGQERAGPIGIVMLAAAGTRLRAGDSFGSLESQKFVGHLVSPVAGVVHAANARVLDEPGLINADPFGEGWLVELEVHAPDQLEALLRTDASIREYLETGLARCRTSSAPSKPLPRTADARESA